MPTILGCVTTVLKVYVIVWKLLSVNFGCCCPNLPWNLMHGLLFMRRLEDYFTFMEECEPISFDLRGQIVHPRTGTQRRRSAGVVYYKFAARYFGAI